MGQNVVYNTFPLDFLPFDSLFDLLLGSTLLVLLPIASAVFRTLLDQDLLFPIPVVPWKWKQF